MTNWVAIAYGVCIPLQFLFAVYALVFGIFWNKRHRKIADTETFVTARKSQGRWRIGWSFFAGAVGAWVLVSPPSYAAFAGIVGVVVYAALSGLPLLLIAFCGEVITRNAAHVYSLSDFIGRRYGPIAKTLVVLLALFNMGVALLAEYTTLGSLFADFVGSLSWPVVLSVGVLTLAYTAYGGLVVSIATDQVQGMAALALSVALAIYVGVTFRYPLADPLPSYAAGDAFDLGPNTAGYTSIFTLGVSLSAATVFSEAMWQRVWASESKSTLRFGAVLGCVLTTCVVFLSGFGGWLAMAAGLATAETNPNLYLFQLFSGAPGVSATLDSAVGMVTLVLAVVMNEGAVDSIQNGLAASISSQWFRTSPLIYSRVALIILNVPLIVVATLNLNVLSLFLVTNLLSACGVGPVLLGLWRGGARWVHETAMVVGVCCGVLGVTALGVALYWDPNDVAASFSTGANWAWYGNQYDWRVFLVALTASTGMTLLWAGAAAGVKAATGWGGPGISGVLMHIPAMREVTGCPNWDADGHYLMQYEMDTAPIEQLPDQAPDGPLTSELHARAPPPELDPQLLPPLKAVALPPSVVRA